MKTLLFVLFVSFVVNLRAQLPSKYLPVVPAAAMQDPYRKAAGRYWNLTPLYTAPFAHHPTLPGWTRIWGTVAQNGHGGIFILRNDYFGGGGNKARVFIKNYPYQVPDGRYLTCFALASGTMQYTAVDGADVTVAQYDYGIPYDPFLLPPKTNLTVAITTNSAVTNIAKPKARTIYK